MIIDVLVCRPDGTQVLEQREVPEDWFVSGMEAETGSEK
jgi:hypothetical protein